LGILDDKNVFLQEADFSYSSPTANSLGRKRQLSHFAHLLCSSATALNAIALRR